MRLLADECLDFNLVSLLRAAGFDVLTIRDLGLDNQRFTDRDVLKTANEHHRCVITVNYKHYRALFHEGLAQCLIIVLRYPAWMKTEQLHELVVDELAGCQASPVRLIRIGFGLTPPPPQVSMR